MKRMHKGGIRAPIAHLIIAVAAVALWAIPTGSTAYAGDAGRPPFDVSGEHDDTAALDGKRLVTPAGVVEYVAVLEMEASAYYPGPESTAPWTDGTTSAGLAAGHGVVAVDPRVVPLGTMLYIPGYGVAIAGDVGSAIKGHKIDLGFDSYREAIFFGRRPVDVYVLSPAWVEANGVEDVPATWLALAAQAMTGAGVP